ncbi:MAG: NfeD family protein [Candidatus Riflebacteria bacterium]|nr:NfeD family protein [Candidatus Riflebacteria bacterium]
MRFVGLLLCFLIFLPLLAGAQGDLLPEKAPAFESSSAAAPASEQPEEPSWGTIVILLMLGGFFFLFLEIAIIPGFGITGVIGLLLLGAAITAAYMKLSSGMAVFATFAGVFGVILLLLWFFFVFPKTRFGKHFVLEAESSTAEGFLAVEDLKRYLGKEGVTTTMLRPSGIARIDDERLDVITDGEFIEKGVKIKVIKTAAGRIIVTAITDQS